MLGTGTIIAILAALGLGGIAASGYVKAPTDKAFIISGLRKNPRFIIGKSAIKIPFLERKDELELKLIPIDVKTASTVPTADYINVRVDSAVNIKIGSNDTLIRLAAQNFLGQTTNYIADIAREVLEGNIREIVGKMKLEEMVKDRQMFAELVKENAEPDLAAMGLEIISFNVQNFSDDAGVIENLGIDNIVTIKKNAEISRANAEKEIAQAKARAEQEANEAKVIAEQEIAIKNNELSIKKAELKIEQDTKRAEADAAYTIQQEEQRKTVETKQAEANIIKQEKAIQLADKRAQVTEKELEATIKKKADADLYDSQRQAEADLYKRKKEAEAKAFEQQTAADADRYNVEQQANALKLQAEAELVSKQREAEGIAAVGKAEAEAIQAKLLAEAEGLDKKAEAMAKMQQAAVIEMVVDKLPEIVKNAAAPLANVDSITMYGEGNSAKMVEDVMMSTSKIMNGIEGATGLNIKSLLSGMLGAKLISNDCSHNDAE